jgi:hypothetical protein
MDASKNRRSTELNEIHTNLESGSGIDFYDDCDIEESDDDDDHHHYSSYKKQNLES